MGKTVMCVNELIKSAMTTKRDRPRLAYIAPLYRQAKQVAWDYVKHFSGPIPGVSFNESELRADYPNGARISLYGADNPDALRGIYLDGVVLDEYAQMSPRLWGEVIRPALTDREGWAIFIGTPMGHNAFWELYDQAKSDPLWYAEVFRASETGILPREELDAARQQMGEDEYEQEFECSFTAAIKGAYYGHLMAAADQQNRITNVQHEPTLPVSTWWDLGMRDSTAIWFVQRRGLNIAVIDYYEASGEGLQHYVSVLEEKGRPKNAVPGYSYDRHVAPHDIQVRELGADGRSRLETAAQLGLLFDVTPRWSLPDGIQAVRNILPRCWFDATKCARGIEALRQYRKDFDEKLNVFRTQPLHDWTSHAADAFRYGAIGWQEEQLAEEEEDSMFSWQTAGRSESTGY